VGWNLDIDFDFTAWDRMVRTLARWRGLGLPAPSKHAAYRWGSVALQPKQLRGIPASVFAQPLCVGAHAPIAITLLAAFRMQFRTLFSKPTTALDHLQARVSARTPCNQLPSVE